MKRFLFILCLSSVITPKYFQTVAQEIWGGEFSWNSVGNDSFLISLHLYVSCKSNEPSQAKIVIACASNGHALDSGFVSASFSNDVTNVCLSQCSPCLNPDCEFPYGVKKYTFTKLFDLSDAGSCCDLLIYYHQYHRDSGLTNTMPFSAFYLEAKLNRCLSFADQSPLFLNDPIFLQCKDQPYYFSHAAFDPDIVNGIRDSVVYELSCPKVSGDSFIAYTGNYSYIKPLRFGGYPNAGLTYPQGFHLDPILGEMYYVPQDTAKAVMAVKVSVYREGKKISEITREWLQIIMNCPFNSGPTVSGSFYREHCAENDLIMAFTTYDYNTGDKPSVYMSSAVRDAHFVITGIPPNYMGYISWAPENEQASYSPYFFTVGVRDNVCPVDLRQVKTARILVKENVKADVLVSDSGCGYYYYQLANLYGNPISYEWIGDGGLKSYAPSFIHKYANTDTFEIKMILTAPNSCKYTYLFYILGETEPPVVYAGKDDSICSGSEKIVLSGVPESETASWVGKGLEKEDTLWYFNPLSHEVEPGNFYNLIYHYAYSQYCSNEDTIKLYVINAPKAEAGIYSDLCHQNSPLRLKGTPSGGVWHGSYIDQNYFIPEMVGQHLVIYEAHVNGWCSDYDTGIISVNPKPEIKFGVKPLNGDVPLTVIFRDSSDISSGYITKYLWNFGDGTINEDFGTTSHTYLKEGDYSVVLILQSDKGCENYRIETNVVNAWPQFIPEGEEVHLLIYPNPSGDRIKAEISGHIISSFVLFDLSGELVQEQREIDLSSFTINTHSLSSGIYALKVILEDGKVVYKKLIIK